MTTVDLRSRYIENIEVIKKLKDLLNKTSEDRKKLVLDSIKKVEDEQAELHKRIRRDIYKNISKKDISNLIKNNEKTKDLSENKKNNNKNDETEEIVLNKDDVVITQVEEKEEPIKVINITEKKPDKRFYTQDDEPTEVLKESVSNEELKDAKIVFDGTFKLIYDNGKKVYEKEIDVNLLDHNISEKKSAFNFNIIKLLKEFDEKYNTKVYFRYMINDIDVVYDFTKINKSVDRKQVKKVREMAKRESKAFNNIKVKDERMKKFRTGLTAVAAAGLLLFGGIHSFNKQSKNTFNNDKATVSNAGQTDAAMEDVTEYLEIDSEEPKTEEVKKKVETSTETSVTPTIKETKDEHNDKEESIIDKTTVSTDKETEVKNSPKIGDVYELNSVDLYHASTDENPLGNTSYAKETNSVFKINLIAVVYNNQVMKLVYNDSMDLDTLESICKEKYGNDFKIFVNPNELDKDGNLITENVGWIPKEQFLSKGKVLTR